MQKEYLALACHQEMKWSVRIGSRLGCKLRSWPFSNHWLRHHCRTTIKNPPVTRVRTSRHSGARRVRMVFDERTSDYTILGKKPIHLPARPKAAQPQKPGMRCPPPGSPPFSIISQPIVHLWATAFKNVRYCPPPCNLKVALCAGPFNLLNLVDRTRHYIV